MAIENTYLTGSGVQLGTSHFDLQAQKPLDSRTTVPAFAGLQALIDGKAAYEGMIVFDEETKKTYQAQKVDGVLKFREFGLTEAELKDLIASETTAAMEFKGAATALPENPAKGDFYKVTSEFAVGEETAKVGDSIVYDGAAWCIIPSGDDIEDTWRPVTGVDNDSTLTFVAGDKLEKTVAADGTITYKHVAVDAPELLAENEQTRTYITEVETDGFGHITGYKTATENVVDTNTTYEFEGQSAEATSVYFQVTASDDEAAEVIYLDTYSKNEADGKFVAKETGKSLVADDEIERLSKVDNYDDEEVRGLIGDNAQAIEDLADYVGTIPTDDKYKDLSVVAYIDKKAEETLAAAQGGSSETAASVKQQLDNYKSSNDTRVKAAEDAIAAINNDTTGILKQAQDYADGLASNYDEKGAAAGVKTELTAEINKKVTAVDGKDLIATSEIERLTTLVNYDDTQVKADIATKASTEFVNTELSKKVDKVEGYSLVSDTEIARLAGVSNYDDTTVKADIAKKADTATMTTELGKKVDKVEGYSLVSDTEIARLADVDNYDDAEVRGLIGDNADAISALAGKVGEVGEGQTVMGIIKNIQENAYDDTELRGLISGNTEAIATKVAKSDYDVKVQELVDAIDAIEADYLKAADKTELSNAVAAEKERAEGIEAGLRTDVDAIKADYLKASDKEALQTQIDTIMNNPDTEGVINSINEFTQYIADHGEVAEGFRTDIDANAKSIEDLESYVGTIPDFGGATTVCDYITAVRERGDQAYVLTENLDSLVEGYELETKSDASAKLTEAKGYTDTEVAKDRERISTLEAIDHDAYVAADTALKTELQGEIDADVKVVNDALEAYKTSNNEEVAKKANSADVYAKTETYTKSEVEALFTWGEF